MAFPDPGPLPASDRLRLPNSGILIQYTMMYGLNPDGSSSEEAGTTPDILSPAGESALATALRAIEKARG